MINDMRNDSKNGRASLPKTLADVGLLPNTAKHRGKTVAEHADTAEWIPHMKSLRIRPWHTDIWS